MKQDQQGYIEKGQEIFVPGLFGRNSCYYHEKSQTITEKGLIKEVIIHLKGMNGGVNSAVNTQQSEA